MVWESDICQKTEGSHVYPTKSIAFCCKKLSPRHVYLATLRVLWESWFWGCRFPWVCFNNLCLWSSWQPRASRRLHESFTNWCFPPKAHYGRFFENGFLMDLFGFRWISDGFLWVSFKFLLISFIVRWKTPWFRVDCPFCISFCRDRTYTQRNP